MSDDLERDPETGRITGNKLSTEEARALANKRWNKPLKEDTEALILESGYQNTKDCPTDFRLLCERAAGGDVRAILEYMKKTRPKEMLDLDVNTCVYYEDGGCIMFKVQADTWREGEKEAEITAVKQRIDAYRYEAENR